MDWDLVIVFTFIVVVTAVRSHYRRLERVGAGLDSGDRTALDRAMEIARRLEQRIETLERLLDEDSPGWRVRARS
jgi:phage shock protein B